VLIKTLHGQLLLCSHIGEGLTDSGLHPVDDGMSCSSRRHETIPADGNEIFPLFAQGCGLGIDRAALGGKASQLAQRAGFDVGQRRGEGRGGGIDAGLSIPATA
jgi:hypothetical protein